MPARAENTRSVPTQSIMIEVELAAYPHSLSLIKEQHVQLVLLGWESILGMAGKKMSTCVGYLGAYTSTPSTWTVQSHLTQVNCVLSGTAVGTVALLPKDPTAMLVA